MKRFSMRFFICSAVVLIKPLVTFVDGSLTAGGEFVCVGVRCEEPFGIGKAVGLCLNNNGQEYGSDRVVMDISPGKFNSFAWEKKVKR